MSATAARISKTLRFPPDALAKIDAQAQVHGLNRTQYIIKASTGELPHTTTQAIERIEALEAAVQRLEQHAYGTP